MVDDPRILNESIANNYFNTALCPFFKTPCKKEGCLAYIEVPARQIANVYCRAMVRMEQAAQLGVKDREYSI